MVKLLDSVRNQHLYIAGKTRHGKSTEIHALIYQDLKAGKGVGVLDPKGDLVESLLHWMPENRIDDCIYLDLETPIPLDFMSCKPNEESKVVSDLKFILTKGISLDAAPTLSSNLEEVIYTLLDANAHPDIPFDKKATFLDIQDFLTRKDRRDLLLTYVTNPKLRDWKKDLPNPTDIGRVVSRIKAFSLNPTLSKIFGEPNARLNIPDIINNKKVLLVNVPADDETAQIYGALLVSKIQQAAFRRRNIPENKRVPFHLYVDEFQNFQTSSFDKILSMAGGYQLCLTLANQYLSQVKDLLDAIFGNVGSYIVFEIEAQYTARFKAITQPFDHENLAELGKYRALKKFSGQKAVIEPSHKPPPPYSKDEPFSPEQREKALYIRRKTFERYGPRPKTSAEDSDKRIVQNHPSQSLVNVLDLENDRSSIDGEDDQTLLFDRTERTNLRRNRPARTHDGEPPRPNPRRQD